MSAKSGYEAATQSESVVVENDSFEALLRQAAHVTTARAHARSLLPAGTSLAGGRFSILRRIGEGGMGVVYEAFDAQRKARVALKTLTRVDAAGVYRLKNEFRALADVRHANLIALHELFSTEHAWFFTMDLVGGERIDRWVRPDAQLDEARLRAVLSQLVAAIGAIHDAGKLHRDLKPSNVLVTLDGSVVVLDFGLVVDPELGGVGQTIDDDSVSGTPAYMAPEQAAGEPATAASDFYAVGVMLFEALTGRLPFEGKSGEILAAKQRLEAPRPSALVNGVSADLDALCAGLLARDTLSRGNAIARCSALALETRSQERRPSGAPRAARSAESGGPLLGREAELRTLHDAFEATLSGQPVFLFISGESGIGKSALVDTFIGELREQSRATVLAGRCYERENVPHKGLDALVDDLSRHLRKVPPHEAAAVLPREAFALTHVFPVLDRVPVVAEVPKRHVPDPQDLKHRACGAFGELIARMRDRAPLVLVLDDLQWIDQDSTRFMRALLVRREVAPVLFVCVHRSEGAAGNALLQSVIQGAHDSASIAVRRLALAPLPHAALVELARRLLPASVESSVAELLATEAHGSPFFAAELARSSLELARAAPSLPEALAIHVAALPVEAQRVLVLLALAGQPLAPRLALEAASLSDGQAHLDRLRAEQLVRVSFDVEGGRLIECYHDKIREHLIAALDPLRTKELALGLSRALLAAPASDSELLARILELAGLPEQAAEHAAHAAERAFAALAFEHAATLFERALAKGRFDPARSSQLHAALAEALAHAGQGARAAEAFITAADRAEGGAKHELTRKAAEQYFMCGENERGRALLAQTLPQVGIAFPRSLGAALLGVTVSRTRLRLRGLGYTARAHHEPATLRRLELLRTITHGLVRSDHLRAAHFAALWLASALDAGHEVEIGRALSWEIEFATNVRSDPKYIERVIALCAELCAHTHDRFAASWFDYTCGLNAMTQFADPDVALGRFARSLATLDANPSATASYDRAWTQFFRSAGLLVAGRFCEGAQIAEIELEHVLARGDQTLIVPLSMSAMWGALATDRADHAIRLRETASARLLSNLRLSELFWFSWESMPALYCGRAREAWYAAAASREIYHRSMTARLILPGVTEGMLCGVAAEAARQAESRAEQQALIRKAQHLAKRTRNFPCTPSPTAVIACLRGDRSVAIAALRKRLDEPVGRYLQYMLRRRLGVLLGGDEGASLIAAADDAMRAGGVLDPARFTAALTPGLELSTPPLLEPK